MAVRNGCDLECGGVFSTLVEASRQGLISEAEIDRAAARLLRARFRLGMFDPSESVPYAKIPYGTVDSKGHRDLAREAARASIVLLKNQDAFLPLSKDLGCIAVIGPNADDREVLLGNYNGFPSVSVTILEGIRRAVSVKTRVLYARGSDITKGADSPWGDKPDDGFGEAMAAAESADVVVMALGLNNRVEGEEGSAASSEWSGDRVSIELPAIQRQLFEAVATKGKPIVLVLLSGSALAIPRENSVSRAVLLAWYPGEEGGTAVADVLFGDHAPSGRLPVTFVESIDQLPQFTDYAMTGRTYRFMEAEPLYPFGFGLSYTAFRYSGLKLEKPAVPAGEAVGLSVDVRNDGARGGDEVVQVYLTDLEASVQVPLRQLVGFARVHLEPGQTRSVSFRIQATQMSLIDEEGRRMLEPGRFRVCVGGRQPDARSQALTGTVVLCAEFDVTGTRRELAY
jgi:beta-glucosidase